MQQKTVASWYIEKRFLWSGEPLKRILLKFISLLLESLCKAILYLVNIKQKFFQFSLVRVGSVRGALRVSVVQKMS
jgi:hypothetical protein